MFTQWQITAYGTLHEYKYIILACMKDGSPMVPYFKTYLKHSNPTAAKPR